MTQQHHDRLDIVSKELRGLYIDHSQLVIAEHQAKAAAYMNSRETSASGRASDATHFSVDQSVEVLEIWGRIRALEEERDHLRFVIQFGSLRDEVVM